VVIAVSIIGDANHHGVYLPWAYVYWAVYRPVFRSNDEPDHGSGMAALTNPDAVHDI
jgi:hypothetical protein